MTPFRAALLALGLALAAVPAVAGERPTLVELFTSEGCSSCPPADALLAELSARPDLLALSLHVDYWDGLGWKDPFSAPAMTARQQRYSRQLDLATVYTPQIVVDGLWEAVGSDRDAVTEALAAATRDRTEVPVTLAVSGGRARIKIGGAAAVSASVVLIGFDRHAAAAVRGGENDGHTLAHVDVVRGIVPVGEFRGPTAEIAVALPWRSQRVAAIVQAADGRVLGVAVGDAEPL